MAQPAKRSADIVEIIDHAPGLRTLIFETERPVPKFRPGQFLHLAIDECDPSMHWPDSRVFSIASPPTERTTIQVVFSEVGRFTKRMMKLDVGDKVWLKLPFGDFFIEQELDSSVVLVAGGTGITPFLSWIRTKQCLTSSVRLLYGVRRPELLLFADELDAATDRDANFAWTGFTEERAFEVRGLRSGRLSVEAAVEKAESIGGLDRAVFYISGPPALLSVFREELRERGISESAVRIDAWE